MNKKLFLVLSFSIVFVLALSVISAGYYDYGYNYPSYTTNNYKETTEFKRTTDSYYGNRYNNERIKTTITEKTEISRTNRIPSYSYYPPYGKRYDYQPRFISYSNYRNRPDYGYKYYRYDDEPEFDYYYRPIYDYNLGYFNHRY